MNRRDRLKRELFEMLEMVKSVDPIPEPALPSPPFEPVTLPEETPQEQVYEPEAHDSYEREPDQEQPKKKVKKV
jgi:hypothetical protein